MNATRWEFSFRALIFGLIFGVSFSMYSLDPQNTGAWLANWAGDQWHVNPDSLGRLLFAAGALLLAIAALFRSWASAYLHAGVVYAGEVKTTKLVADGPYRWVRNPLYFGNVLMALGMGFMMSRLGFCVDVVLMVLFCYRLIFREEEELRLTQGEAYACYLAAVPRLLPSPRPLVAAGPNPVCWMPDSRPNSGVGASRRRCWPSH